MDLQQYVEQRPDVMMGKPVLTGTRLTIEFILERLADGATEADLLHAHPRLRSEHLQAVRAWCKQGAAN